MFKEIFIIAMFVAVVYTAPAQQQDEPPTPYEFAFEEKNKDHTLARQESGDQRGAIKGQYSFTDKDGLTRVVVYEADDDGFRAQIKSNEPGLVSHSPAAATYSVQ